MAEATYNLQRSTTDAWELWEYQSVGHRCNTVQKVGRVVRERGEDGREQWFVDLVEWQPDGEQGWWRWHREPGRPEHGWLVQQGALRALLDRVKGKGAS